MHSPHNKILSQRISIDLGSLIGQGSSGNVYHGFIHHPQQSPIAIKAIPLKEVNNQVTGYLLQCQLQALKVVSRVQNSSIVHLEDIIVVDDHCYIAMELLEGGTLKDFIVGSKFIREDKALQILHNLLKGYKILKSHGIVHRDLKPDNIIFPTNPDKNFCLPKIIDFGYCQNESIKKKPNMFYNVGSPRYMSPQAYQENIYSEKSDIWSLGITFYEMLTGTTFDKGKNIVQTFQLLKHKGIPIPPNFSQKTKKILQGMLRFNPNERYGCEQILYEIQKENNRTLSLLNPEINDINHQKINRSNQMMPLDRMKQKMVGEEDFNQHFSKPNRLISPKSQKDLFNNGMANQLNSSISLKNLHIEPQNQHMIGTNQNVGVHSIVQKPYFKNAQNITQNQIKFFSPARNITQIIQSPKYKEIKMQKHKKIPKEQQLNQNFSYAVFKPKKIESSSNQFLNFSERIQPVNLPAKPLPQLRNSPSHFVNFKHHEMKNHYSHIEI